jgi:hypothetical protein
MLQTTAQKPRRGECTPEGRACQIAARVSNGVHYENPILPNGVESQAIWDAHLAGLEEALQPVGSWEKLCVYRIALSAWKHFRLVRHETALVSTAILEPDNEFKSSYDDDYVHADDVAEVLRRSEASVQEELSQVRALMERVSALAGNDLDDISFTSVERRQVLSEIIQQLSNEDGDEDNHDDAADGELADAVGDPTGHDDQDSNDEAADNEDSLIIPAVQLRDEIEQVVRAHGGTAQEAIEAFVGMLTGWIKQRQRRLRLARTHIGACLIPDERNVNRLALYERQLDAASRRYLNDLYRAQALRRGEAVVAPIAVDVNVVGEQGNGLHRRRAG